MDELEIKIKEMLGDFYSRPLDIGIVKKFIQLCSLSDFEKLKEMDWELSQNKG